MQFQNNARLKFPAKAASAQLLAKSWSIVAEE
jgi:hypothetical protein